MGAGRTEEAVQYTKKLLLATYLSMGTLCAVLFFTAAPLVSLFNLSPKSVELAIEILRWNAVFAAIFWPISFMLPNALRAAGDVIFTMVVSLASMFICRICLSYVFGCSWGLDLALLGIWIAMFADWIVRSVFFVIRFLMGKWQKKTVI